MMEKYKNKKGFTLIELIVVIAIVGALSVTMGISAINTMKQTKFRDYEETYADIFDAARLYTGLKVPPESCEETMEIAISCGTVSSYPANISLCCLVEAGLLDYDLTKQYDPLTNDDDFSPEKNINIVIDANGRKIMSTYNDSCEPENENYIISSENVKGYEKWEGDC